MADKYANYSALAKHQRIDSDYRIRYLDRGGRFAIVAPHGGGIEPGTSEIAEFLAGDYFSFYAFEGLKKNGNSDLHITSTNFDEVSCIKVIRNTDTVIAIHGRALTISAAYLGGLDIKLIDRLRQTLTSAGFIALTNDKPEFQGLSIHNICNKGKSGRGVQLELTRSLRETMFESLDTEGRATRLPPFYSFVSALTAALG